MSIDIIILGAIFVLTVVAHGIFFLYSQSQHKKFMQEIQSLTERIKELQSDYGDMDDSLDEADIDMEKLRQEIELFRSILCLNKKMTTFDN